MTRTELISRVKVNMDESTPDGVSQSFDSYIDALLDESAKEISDTAPLQLLTPTALPVVLDTNLFYESNLAYIQVPSDFSRIANIKFATWKKSITLALKPGDPKFDMQEDEYIKSGSSRPTVLLKYATPASQSLQNWLICGKVSLSEAILISTYIKYVVAESLPTVLQEAVTWLCASKVLGVANESDASKYALERATTSINEKI